MSVVEHLNGIIWDELTGPVLLLFITYTCPCSPDKCLNGITDANEIHNVSLHLRKCI